MAGTDTFFDAHQRATVEAAMARIIGFITLAIGVNFLASAIGILFPGLTR